jgi:hypothetical protein
MELIIKIWRFGIFPTEIYHKNLTNLGHLSMKNPFYRRKLHFSGRNLMGFRPKNKKKHWPRKVAEICLPPRLPPRGKFSLHSDREKQTNPRAHSQPRLRAGRRASLLRCNNSSRHLENVNGRRIAAHSQAHYWLDQATPVFLKKIRQRNKYYRSLGHLILSASSDCRISGYVLPRAHNKTSMQRIGSCFSFVEFFALVVMEYDWTSCSFFFVFLFSVSLILPFVFEKRAC